MVSETETASDVAVANLPAVIPEAELIARDDFTEEQAARVAEIVAGTDLTSSQTSLTFAEAPQRKLSDHLDELLAGALTRDAGTAGDLVAEIATGLDMIDVKGLKDEADSGGFQGFLASLPMIGPWFSAFARFRARHTQVLKHFETIEQKARDDKAELLRVQSKGDQLVDYIRENLDALKLFIAAGQDAANTAVAKAAEMQATIAGDPQRAADYQDFVANVTAFRVRVDRLRLAYLEGIRAIPETRMTQQAARIEVQNIMDSILVDIPRLKRAVAQIVALKSVRDAQKATQARADLANRISEEVGDVMNEAYTAAKESQGRTLGDVELLASEVEKLNQTIAKGAEIDKQNEVKAAQAHELMVSVKQQLTQALEQVAPTDADAAA